jgi:hypothetical protein
MDTLESSRFDLGVKARAQRIFVSLPCGRRKPADRRDLGVHLRARGEMNGRLLRTGLGETERHTLILLIPGQTSFPK